MAKRIGKYKVSKKEIATSLVDGGIANGNLTTAVGLTLGTQTVAAAGSDQDGAGAISATGGPVVFVTGADNTKGVRLPLLSAVNVGQLVLVCNNLSNKTLEIYPGSGDAINVLSDDGGLTVAADTITMFIRMDAAEWFAAELPVVAA
tara:strand:- start:1234 stop:1674 length:441 start_codon:yes stop_codon:yes gene_type:complete